MEILLSMHIIHLNIKLPLNNKIIIMNIEKCSTLSRITHNINTCGRIQKEKWDK
jgi:hypothetical protein